MEALGSVPCTSKPSEIKEKQRKNLGTVWNVKRIQAGLTEDRDEVGTSHGEGGSGTILTWALRPQAATWTREASPA